MTAVPSVWTQSFECQLPPCLKLSLKLPNLVPLPPRRIVDRLHVLLQNSAESILAVSLPVQLPHRPDRVQVIAVACLKSSMQSRPFVDQPVHQVLIFRKHGEKWIPLGKPVALRRIHRGPHGSQVPEFIVHYKRPRNEMIDPPYFLPQHFLYFFPLPQGHGSLGYIFFVPAAILPEIPSGMDMVGISSAL